MIIDMDKDVIKDRSAPPKGLFFRVNHKVEDGEVIETEFPFKTPEEKVTQRAKAADLFRSLVANPALVFVEAWDCDETKRNQGSATQLWMFEPR